ncbi:putative isomerase YraM [Tolypocladium ophioglossoides CBS 100239]|uniref:Putative isomerase YraM n=1 Tax=Tolypocladium ophioglossoides (strain CBS 100239) TaxID=1163406 RepID=A0A0L0N5P0_TOLOC|nr:putative isomerase YraM [Tolypocladium ophioglossoides CBS 100239]
MPPQRCCQVRDGLKHEPAMARPRTKESSHDGLRSPHRRQGMANSPVYRLFVRSFARHAIQTLERDSSSSLQYSISKQPFKPTRTEFPNMAVHETPRPRLTCHTLPCVVMRAGTSKGLFIHKKDLPAKQSDWAPHLISALGSRGADPRQIDGIGGGSSTTSKVAVVSPSRRPGIDVDFTFVQVAVGKEAVDFSGNCGNMVSGVGPFAVQEGLVMPHGGEAQMDVRIFNTNTNRTIVETVEIDETGSFIEDGSYTIPGVSTTGSEVRVTFVDPAGSMTGKLFPSGKRQQTLAVQPPLAMAHVGSFTVKVTLVDASNPFVLVDATSIAALLQTTSSAGDKDMLVEAVRRQGAVAMGLASSVDAAAKTRGTPKVALVYPPVFQEKGAPDIRVQSYSMGQPHPSLQLTGAVCLAAALSAPGTVAAELSARPVIEDGALLTPQRTPSPSAEIASAGDHGQRREREVVLAHSKGTIRVGVVLGDEDRVESCMVSRTARRLFEGKVRYYV